MPAAGAVAIGHLACATPRGWLYDPGTPVCQLPSGSLHLRRLLCNRWFLGDVSSMESRGGLMSIRNLFSWLLIVTASFTLSARAFAQGEWAVEKTFHVGGEGGFDYITVDAKSHRIYVPRSTHTMVIDADSGKTVADITGQKHNHGVALVPEVGRGFISDGSGAVV